MLHEILTNKRRELAESRREVKTGITQRQLRGLPAVRSLKHALTASSSVSIIAEIKRKSPSKGVLARSVEPAALASKYQAGGAAAISVLTDKKFFCGSIDDLVVVRSHTSLPVLRKDFIVDESQIHESRVAGADAILLIVAALEERELIRLYRAAREMSLEALVEVHDEHELDIALKIGAQIIGINNRNLKTFEVDLSTTERLRGLVPPHVVCVSESGVVTRSDVERLQSIDVDAVLVGERIMTAPDPETAIHELIGGGHDKD